MMEAGAHVNAATAGAVGFDDTGATVDDRGGREVRTGNVLHQLIDGQLRVVDKGQTTVDDFTDVVRRDVGCHAHGDHRFFQASGVHQCEDQAPRFLEQAVVEWMQVDLEADGASVEGLPRFQQGLFHARRLRQAGISLTAVAVCGWVLALFVALFAPLSIWPVVLINCASALLLLVAGLQSAWWVADWRAQALEEPPQEAPVEETGRYARLAGRFGKQIGTPVLWLGGWSLLALISIVEFWNLALPAAAVGQSATIGAALALALAFGLLVSSSGTSCGGSSNAWARQSATHHAD